MTRPLQKRSVVSFMLVLTFCVITCLTQWIFKCHWCLLLCIWWWAVTDRWLIVILYLKHTGEAEDSSCSQWSDRSWRVRGTRRTRWPWAPAHWEVSVRGRLSVICDTQPRAYEGLLCPSLPVACQMPLCPQMINLALLRSAPLCWPINISHTSAPQRPFVWVRIHYEFRFIQARYPTRNVTFFFNTAAMLHDLITRSCVNTHSELINTASSSPLSLNFCVQREILYVNSLGFGVQRWKVTVTSVLSHSHQRNSSRTPGESFTTSGTSVHLNWWTNCADMRVNCNMTGWWCHATVTIILV